MMNSFAFHGKLPSSVNIKYKSMGVAKKKTCKLVCDHRPLMLQLSAFTDNSWPHIISDLGYVPDPRAGSWITTHICSVCCKFGHMSNECSRLGTNKQKKKDFHHTTTEHNMLVMAEHTPQIDKGSGLESYSDRKKAATVVEGMSEVDLDTQAAAPAGWQ